jgi:hypothetical protein
MGGVSLRLISLFLDIIEVVKMIEEAFLANLKITNEAIQAAVAELFAIDSLSIFIIEDICDPNIPVPSNQVLIERRDIGGDFPLVLTLYVKGKILTNRSSNVLDDISFLCYKLGYQALTSDLEINPYSWYLVGTDRSVRSVYVDAAKLDDLGQFAVDWNLSNLNSG